MELFNMWQWQIVLLLVSILFHHILYWLVRNSFPKEKRNSVVPLPESFKYAPLELIITASRRNSALKILAVLYGILLIGLIIGFVFIGWGVYGIV